MGDPEVEGQKSPKSIFEFRVSNLQRGKVQTTEAIAHIDGASRGNPGPAAYAVVMESSDGSRREGFSGCLGVTTNNVAEYQALLAALEYALRNHYRSLHVQTDSELLALQIEGVYKVKSPALKPLVERARQMIRRLESFSIQHVPREQNQEADRLANQALDAAAGGSAGVPPVVARASCPRRSTGVTRPLDSGRDAPPTMFTAASDGGTASLPSPALRASATYRGGRLEPHEQLALFEGEEVDLEIYRKE